MSDIGLSIDVDDRRLQARFEALPEALKAQLIPRLRAIDDAFLAAVHAAEPRRTGRLIQETQGFLNVGPDYVRAVVKVLRDAGGTGRDNAKAAALEYGAHATITVRGYEALHGENVAAYQRRVSIAEHRFLRDPFERIKGPAQAAIEEAIAAVTKEV